MAATRSRTVSVVLVAALFGALGVAAPAVPMIKAAENWVRDLRATLLAPPAPPSDDVVIVAITEETLATLRYRSPVDRRFLADLVRTLQRKGARAIGLDILLDSPTEPDKDRELQETLRGAAIPVILASGGREDGLRPRQIDYLNTYTDHLRHGLAVVIEDPEDGVVRAVLLNRSAPKESLEGFVTAIARAIGADVPDTPLLRLDYRRGPDRDTAAFARFPAHELGNLPDSWIAGKTALVGADLPLADRHRTPLSAIGSTWAPDMTGVEIQAHALSQLMEQREFRGPTRWHQVTAIVLFALLGGAIAASRFPFVVKGAATAGVLVLLWILGFAVYRLGGPLFPLVVPTGVLVATTGTLAGWSEHRERKQRRYLHQAFSKYLAPEVIEQLVRDPTRLTLGGEEREASFLFTDVTGFTSLAERLEPAAVIALMNEYLDGVCDIVHRHRGTIDKFVGDAVHAMFNAPIDQPDHAERAVACAIEVDAFAEGFRARENSRGIPFGETRIGLNTGVAVVGNMGGTTRFDYSATGDAINTAARLEGANKYLGTRVCISETTAHRCPDVQFRPIGRLILKGKTRALLVFEPQSAVAAAASKHQDYTQAYQQLERGGAGAGRAFSRLAERFPEDRLIAFHAERLATGATGDVIELKEK